MSAIAALVARDVRLAFRQGGGGLLAVGFFAVTCILFPFGIGPEPEVLRRVAAGVVWVAALLACLLSLDRMFQADLEDGSLDLLALGRTPLELVVLAKCLAHWLTTGLPLVAMAPVLAALLNLETGAWPMLLAALLLGTPALSLIGAVGAALTVGVRRGGVLLSLLVLPLTVPVLIFGVAAVEAAALGLNPRPHLLLLAGTGLFAAVLAPLAGAAALRLALD